MDSSAPIRSRAAEEGDFQIPLWSIPFILIVLYVCLFSGLGALGLVGPDEPRYAAIARAMAETHDWVTPRLWGTPWFEKPVLYYWAAGISMRLFGVSEFAARLPSALAALLAVLVVAWTALRSFGVRAAWFSLLMLPTSVAMVGFSRAASPDMLFAGLLTAAMAVAVEILQKPRPGPILRIAFGIFLGAAVLAKGPAAVILAGGATLLWAALSRQWHAPFRFLHPLIFVVFCAVALPWYVLCALRNPDFLRVFILQHNFERYLSPIFEHRQPFWFYAPILCVATMPWIFVLVRASYLRRSQEEWSRSPLLFSLCWAVFPLLFFSFSQSKLPGYILPAIPPLFLFMSGAMQRLFASSNRGAAVLTGITGAMFTACAIFAGKALLRTANTFNISNSRSIALLAILGVGGLIAVVFSTRKRPMSGITALVLVVVAALVFLNSGILPATDARISARAAANDALRLDLAGKNIAVYGLKRDWNYGLSYYFRRELPEWTPGKQLPEWLFTSDKNCAELERQRDRIREASRAGAPFAVLLHILPDVPNAPQ
ncbi:MAG: glycosyltransferase family 39 protein [Acidobacteriia bacterium]|nr:glycosyltransferase family 39 protein [Terriglobia bacterium]